MPLQSIDHSAHEDASPPHKVDRSLCEPIFRGIGVERNVLLFLESREKINLVNTMALNSEVKIPMISVVANPRIAQNQMRRARWPLEGREFASMMAL